MLAKVFSAAVLGIDAYKVEIEVNATMWGKESFVNVVGLPDNAVRESKDRVQSAIESCALPYPYGKTVVNLAPADIKKEGASFDLPIALGMLVAGGSLPKEKVEGGLFVGELALHGLVRPVKGALPVALFASGQADIRFLMVPELNAAEAAIASGELPVYPVNNLRQAFEFLSGNIQIDPVKGSLEAARDGSLAPREFPDFMDVKGQSYVKRAIEIAAAGGHNLLMIGPPGTGKSMLAKRVPGILPDMHVREALEVTKIHSIMGLLDPSSPVVSLRPFRSPHHTISDAGLLGGGTIPGPGEVSLAHKGVLFMDELPEFRRNVLEVLRQPLESGNVTISRAAGSLTFPSDFMLIAAMNPCPCGHFGSPQRECRCSTFQVQNYRNKISGPLLDRIDIHVEVAPLSEDELLRAPDGERSEAIRSRVKGARDAQQRRFVGRGLFANARMESAELRDFCALGKDCVDYLRHSIRDLNLSARAYDRILKVARTVADIEGCELINLEHVCEAVQYRTLDRKLW